MAKRTRQEKLDRADPRLTEVPMPCQHCRNLVSMGTQFDDEGWTCSAYPGGILYGILTNREPHTEVNLTQEGYDTFEPEIYTEEETGRRWHYTADAGWRYVEGEGAIA